MLRDRFLNDVWSFVMGKGDRRTFRGKLYNCSYGNKRPQTTKKAIAAPAKVSGKK
jgi:ribosomal small subunit protein bTHX